MQPEDQLSIKLKIIIAVMVAIIVGEAVVLVILATRPAGSAEPAEAAEQSVAQTPSPSTDDIAAVVGELGNIQQQEREKMREISIDFIMSEIDSYYQVNGKSPFIENGGSYSVDAKFVPRYIDESCVSKDSRNLTYQCDAGGFFVDTDGTTFKLKYEGSLANQKDGTTFSSTWKKNNYTVHVYTYAKCGKDGQILQSTTEDKFAVVYVGETNSIICVDNRYK